MIGGRGANGYLQAAPCPDQQEGFERENAGDRDGSQGGDDPAAAKESIEQVRERHYAYDSGKQNCGG